MFMLDLDFLTGQTNKKMCQVEKKTPREKVPIRLVMGRDVCSPVTEEKQIEKAEKAFEKGATKLMQEVLQDRRVFPQRWSFASSFFFLEVGLFGGRGCRFGMLKMEVFELIRS